MARRRFCALDCTDYIANIDQYNSLAWRKKKVDSVLTANRYDSEFAADHDCETRPDRHYMCKGESVISALSACLVQQQEGRTS